MSFSQADLTGVNIGEAESLLSSIRESRSKMNGHVDEMESIKNNINTLYKGDGATTFNNSSSKLNEAVEAILDVLKETEDTLDEYIEKTVDTDGRSANSFETY